MISLAKIKLRIGDNEIEIDSRDFYVDNNFYLVSTSADQLMEIRDKLDHAGYDIKSAEIEMVPKTNQILGDLEAKKVLKLINAFEVTTIAFDPFITSQEMEENNVKKVTFENILSLNEIF